MQFVHNGHGQAEENGEDSDLGTEIPMQLAPDIEENTEQEDLNNRGQWSPLPLEAEDFAGELPVLEEEDAQALADMREQVRHMHTSLPHRLAASAYLVTIT